MMDTRAGGGTLKSIVRDCTPLKVKLRLIWNGLHTYTYAAVSTLFILSIGRRRGGRESCAVLPYIIIQLCVTQRSNLYTFLFLSIHTRGISSRPCSAEYVRFCTREERSVTGTG